MPEPSAARLRRIALQGGLSLVTLAVCIPLALWGVATDEAARLLAQADLRPVLLAAALFALTTVARALRWRSFYRAPLALSDSFAAVASGQFINFMLPSRLGDVARVYVLRRRSGEPAARIAGTLVAEKLADMGMLLVAAVACAPFVQLPGWLLQPAEQAAIVLIAAVVGALFAFTQRERLGRIMSWFTARLSPEQAGAVDHHASMAVDGFDAMRRRAALTVILPWSLVILALMVATNYVLFWSLPMARSWAAAALLLVILQIGVALPSTPGKLGVFQALSGSALALAGVGRDVAFSYSLLLYVVLALTQTVLAAPVLWQELVFRRASRHPAEAA